MLDILCWYCYTKNINKPEKEAMRCAGKRGSSKACSEIFGASSVSFSEKKKKVKSGFYSIIRSSKKQNIQ